MSGKIIIKRMLSSLLSSSGIHWLLEQRGLHHKAFILMYHRIMESPAGCPYYVLPGMFVSTASFESQIAFLKDRFEVVFVEDLVTRIMGGEEVGGLCAITFDDGWWDNFTDAFPLLVKYQVPATMFLATGFIGTDKMFWPEELCHYLGQANFEQRQHLDSAPQAYIRFMEQIGGYRKYKPETHFDRAIEIMKQYSPGNREEILQFFRSNFKSGAAPRQMLNWDEAQKMLTSGLVRFGAHTVNHELLDQIPLEKAKDEISQSRDVIESRLGASVRTFAYPNGNYNENVRKSVEDNGFNVAVTTKKGFFDRGTNLLEIPRIAMHEDVSNTIPMFRSRILFSQF